MPKIRDLGINFIPATMRPPEIGQGGGYQAGPPCPDPSGYHESAECDITPPCPPKSQQPPQCEGQKSAPPDGGGGGGGGKGKDGLNSDDVKQLQQQMQGRIAARF